MKNWAPRTHITTINPSTHMVTGLGSNWTVLQDGEAFTLVDCGYPGDLPNVIGALEYLNLRPEAAAAILVTHGHSDHIGTARVLSDLYGMPIMAAEQEIPNLDGTFRSQLTLNRALLQCWNPLFARWLFHAVKRADGLKDVTVLSAQPISTGEALDLPGQPIPIPTPGHTPGHNSYFLQESGALLSGDALVSGHPIVHRKGPQMLPSFFHQSPREAIESLSELVSYEFGTLLPGHGPAAAITQERVRAVRNEWRRR
ncbi:glyoxylase-like metal-dependent hydrolase (beta-lactamase superfamily II) [Arthrobacter sp. GAS37]|uniref:MBL fold metallo-hydrolase n=1 Tax=Arthrobacter sp. GAS37 TaxID=3156261 RepID=UPI003838204E